MSLACGNVLAAVRPGRVSGAARLPGRLGPDGTGAWGAPTGTTAAVVACRVSPGAACMRNHRAGEMDRR